MYSRDTASPHWILLFLCSLAAVFCSPARADIRLPSVIGDNMVLQASHAAPVWGWADPNEEIRVKLSWRDTEWTIQADEGGKWMLRVPPPEVGGPYEITLTGKNTVTIKNILVGEVWVCSGQSNMEMAVRSAAKAEQEIAAAG